MPKRIIIDLDGTLTEDDPALSYAGKRPNRAVVERLRQYKAEGFEIVVSTARNMRTHAGAVGRINVHTLPVILDWLNRHGVPFDEVLVGKPWCGTEGFYVDDKAVRPSEFVAHDHAGILALLAREGRPDGGA